MTAFLCKQQGHHRSHTPHAYHSHLRIGGSAGLEDVSQRSKNTFPIVFSDIMRGTVANVQIELSSRYC